MAVTKSHPSQRRKTAATKSVAGKPAFRIQPLENFVIVDVTPPETASKGGIILPESAQSVTNRGKVVAVGPGIYEAGQFVPTSVPVGAEVLFEQYAGNEVEIDTKRYRIFRHSSLIGIINANA